MPLIDHRQTALDNIDTPQNLAADYDVTVSDRFWDSKTGKTVDLIDGQIYYEVVYVYHLTPEENNTGHYIYVDTFTEDLQPLVCYSPCVAYTWGDENYAIKTDKDFNIEPMGNITMHAGTFYVWVKGSYPSRVVGGFRIDHPDEAFGNSIGHHSFYIIFVRKVWHGEVEPEPPTGEELRAGFLIEGETEGIAPLTIQLNDFSTGDIVSREWFIQSREDVNIFYISNDQHPEFILIEPGDYYITLTVTDDKGNTAQHIVNNAIKVFADTPPPEVVGIIENRHNTDGRGTVSGGNLYRDKPSGFGYQMISVSIENLEKLIAEAKSREVSYILVYSEIIRLSNENTQFMDDTPELN